MHEVQLGVQEFSHIQCNTNNPLNSFLGATFTEYFQNQLAARLLRSSEHLFHTDLVVNRVKVPDVEWRLRVSSPEAVRVQA